MRERINRLAKGIIDSDMPRMEISPGAIDLPVKAGEIFRTEIIVTSTNGIHLKGLVYSDHFRVKILSPSFGGTRNRIFLETDTRYLESGDEITGALSLVTNGGERSVPFRFSVTRGTAEKTLGSLKTVKDFARIAKEDRESALRLFAYQDFVNCPFMADLKVRALFDAFSSRTNKANALEEFLIAAGAKEPASLKVEDSGYSFALLKGPVEGTVSMTMENPGWFSLAVKTDGDFIRLSKKSVSDEDFTGNHYEFPYSIDPEKLHPGINTGAILFSSEVHAFSVPITASGPESREEDFLRERKRNRKQHFLAYLKYRVRYAIGEPGRISLTEQMKAELMQCTADTEPSHYMVLLMAETELLAGHTDKCLELVNTVRNAVIAVRQTEIYEYFLEEYLCSQIPGQEARKESTIRLLRKFLDEQHMHVLFPLLLGLDTSLGNNPAELSERIRLEFYSGNRSPFLYAAYVNLVSVHPELLHELGNLELHALWFGVRRNLIGPETAHAAAKHAGTVRIWHRMYFPLLSALYKKYPTGDILTALLTVVIKGNMRTPDVHPYFEEGLAQKIGLTGLSEYFLYTLPKQYDRCLPKEVLLYFVTDNMLDSMTRERLYENIILYLKPETRLWGEYRHQIEDFALSELLAGKIDEHLAVIYKHVVCPDMVDQNLADVLPSILNAEKITCTSPYIKSVVIVYPELKTPEVYPLENGMACVPVYEDNALILFQNAYGNRYYGIPFTREKICDMPELLKRCAALSPDHPMIRLKRLKDIAARENRSEAEIREVETGIDALPLSALFRKKMLSVAVSGSMTQSDFLVRANKDMLTGRERAEVCGALIRMGKFREAYDMLRTYDCEEIDCRDLKKLCEKMILDRLFREDRLLMILAEKTHAASGADTDSVILDYLCEHYNGSTEKMLRLLTDAIGVRTETYDLEERLLAQMLFTGNDAAMDQVFTWYINRKKTSDSIVRAYFTMKSAEYFLEERETDDSIFAYLEKTFSGTVEKDKVPTIYQLALTRYYASRKELTPEEKELAEEITGSLLDAGLVFPYYKGLARFIAIPPDILDRAMIMYRGEKDQRIELRARILPYDTDFHTEEMKRMYQGIFVDSKVLFSGETWEYEIYAIGGEKPVLLTHGSMKNAESTSAGNGSRFGCLNDLTVRLAEKDEQGMKEDMKQFVMQEETASRLFGLM